MKRIIYGVTGVAALVAASFAFADEEHGACMSACAKAVAEHRKMCGTMHSGDKDALKACMADAKMHFDTCTAACDASE